MAATTVVEVHPGVCGFVAEVEARTEDQRHVSLRIRSGCENVCATLKGCCSGCVVPSGVFKAMQVVAGLALSVDAGIRFGGVS